MMVEYFVEKNSVVRKVWGRSDTILFIFAGASAEFALNKAVDWLYFTGRLPADPLGRLFSTISYARTMVFAEKQVALKAIEAMTSIHKSVEKKRDAKIPDWAYRDVLFMLIDYSIRAFEVLERKMSVTEKNEVFKVFHQLGVLMGLKGLPDTFKEWEIMRENHLASNLQRSDYSFDLFRQFRKHLGIVRYLILLEAQTLVVPKIVRDLLRFRRISLLHPLVWLYKLSRQVKADRWLRSLIMPPKYQDEINSLDDRIGDASDRRQYERLTYT